MIGCGFAAREIHAPRLQRLSHLFRVTATCDLDEAAARSVAATLGADQIFTDAAALIAAAEIDAVAVMSPIKESFVCAALDRGLDVFAEKPLAERPEGATQLASKALREQRVLVVGTMREHDDALAAARSVLADLGPVLWAELRDACSGGTSAASNPELTEPVLQSALPGPSPRYRNALQTGLLELVHDLAILRELFGAPPSLSDSWVSRDGWNLAGRLTLPGGAPCLFGVAEFGRVVAELFEVVVTVTAERGVLRLAFADANQPDLPTVLAVSGQAPQEFRTDTYLREWEHFHRCIVERHVDTNAAAAAREIGLIYDIADCAG